MARPHLLPPSPSPITNSCSLPPPIHVACGISNYMPQRMDPLKRSAAGSICLRQPKHLMAAGRNDVDLFRVESAPLQLQALDYGFNGRRSVTWIRQGPSSPQALSWAWLSRATVAALITYSCSLGLISKASDASSASKVCLML